MMSSFGSTHPLDVDLSDLVDGLVVGGAADAMAAHINECALCGVKVRRLRDAADDSFDWKATSARTADAARALTFHVARQDQDPVSEAAPGELWSAGTGRRVLVLIVYIDSDRAFVAPVTFDVDSADDETVIVGPARTPFDLSVALYPALSMEVPSAALRTRLGALAGVDELDGLLAGTLPGLSTGAPVEGSTDPRLELRQVIADSVGALNEIPSEPVDASAGWPTSADWVAADLASGLRDRRGAACNVRRVEPEEWGRVAGRSTRWAPVAAVDEVGLLILVFDTPAGLNSEGDYHAALRLLTGFGATAVAVLSCELSANGEMFDAPSLCEGIAVPSGETASPAPVFAGLEPVDLIAKFLDGHVGMSSDRWEVPHPLPGVDVVAQVSAHAERQVALIGEAGRRAKILPKSNAYISVAALGPQLIDALIAALDGSDVVSQLAEIAAEVEE